MRLSQFDELSVDSVVALARIIRDDGPLEYLFQRKNSETWIRLQDRIPFEHHTMRAYVASLRLLSDLEILAVETE